MRGHNGEALHKAFRHYLGEECWDLQLESVPAPPLGVLWGADLFQTYVACCVCAEPPWLAPLVSAAAPAPDDALRANAWKKLAKAIRSKVQVGRLLFCWLDGLGPYLP
jgi:hypothetical protein